MRDANVLAADCKMRRFDMPVLFWLFVSNALHFLRWANIQPGQKVMIAGSTGSIGVMAVQLALKGSGHGRAR